MFEDINQHRAAVAENIQKAMEIGFTGGELEKAKHQVGDIHPNGQWVWTRLPSGREDWRKINRGGGSSESQASSKKQKTEKPSVSDKFSRQEVKLIRALARRSSWDSDAYNDFYELADLLTPKNATKVQSDMGCFKAASKIKEYILDNIYSGNIDFSNASVLNRNLYSLNAAEEEMDSWAKELANKGVKVDFVEEFPIEKIREYKTKARTKLREGIDIKGIIFALAGTKGYWGDKIYQAIEDAVKDKMVERAKKLQEFVDKFKEHKENNKFQQRVKEDLLELLGMRGFVEFKQLSGADLMTEEDREYEHKLAKERENDKPKKERYE